MNSIIILYIYFIASLCKSKLLDVEDFTFYFNSKSYEITTTKLKIPLNDTNINIDLEQLKIDIIDNNEMLIFTLDIINDSNWNEISLISSMADFTKIEYKNYIAIDKALNLHDAQLYCSKYYYANLASINHNNSEIINKLCNMLPNDNCNVCQRPNLLYRTSFIQVNLKLDYEDAENYCFEKFGTHLAQYNDDDDNVNNMISVCNDEPCWINNRLINNDGTITEIGGIAQTQSVFLCNRYLDIDIDAKRRQLINVWDEYINYPQYQSAEASSQEAGQYESGEYDYGYDHGYDQQPNPQQQQQQQQQPHPIYGHYPMMNPRLRMMHMMQMRKMMI